MEPAIVIALIALAASVLSTAATVCGAPALTSRRAATRDPVTLVNLDEAALKINGPGGTKAERVGAKLTLKAKGVYKITMVRQAPDDNHLKLTIK
jgi:hypothetical protein